MSRTLKLLLTGSRPPEQGQYLRLPFSHSALHTLFFLTPHPLTPPQIYLLVFPWNVSGVASKGSLFRASVVLPSSPGTPWVPEVCFQRVGNVSPLHLGGIIAYLAAIWDSYLLEGARSINGTREGLPNNLWEKQRPKLQCATPSPALPWGATSFFREALASLCTLGPVESRGKAAVQPSLGHGKSPDGTVERICSTTRPCPRAKGDW